MTSEAPLEQLATVFVDENAAARFHAMIQNTQSRNEMLSYGLRISSTDPSLIEPVLEVMERVVPQWTKILELEPEEFVEMFEEDELDEDVICIFGFFAMEYQRPHTQLKTNSATTVTIDVRRLTNNQIFNFIIDWLERSFFFKGYAAHTTNEHFEKIWRMAKLPIRRQSRHPPWHELHDYNFRERRNDRPIQILSGTSHDICQMPARPLFRELYSMMNGLLHCMARQRHAFQKEIVAFSIKVNSTETSSWVSSISRKEVHRTMTPRNTNEWSNLFNEFVRREERWFVMYKNGNDLYTRYLREEEGFHEICETSIINQHDVSRKIRDKIGSDHISLFIFGVDGVPRLYVDYNGFRIHFNSTQDICAILNTICRVIQVDAKIVSDCHVEKIEEILDRGIAEQVELGENYGLAFADVSQFERVLNEWCCGEWASKYEPKFENLFSGQDDMDAGSLTTPHIITCLQALESPQYFQDWFEPTARACIFE